MSSKPAPTLNEMVMDEQDVIVSKTDKRGIITYGNREFMKYAKYPESVLLGAPHNIIRHPDMPRAVYKLLWETIESGQEIFAYVKNLSADGSFYWVLANITPVYDGNKNIVGYYSFRRRPERKAIDTISAIYSEMKSIENRYPGNSGMEHSYNFLMNMLNSKRTSYEEFVLSI